MGFNGDEWGLTNHSGDIMGIFLWDIYRNVNYTQQTTGDFVINWIIIGIYLVFMMVPCVTINLIEVSWDSFMGF